MTEIKMSKTEIGFRKDNLIENRFFLGATEAIRSAIFSIWEETSSSCLWNISIPVSLPRMIPYIITTIKPYKNINDKNPNNCCNQCKKIIFILHIYLLKRSKALFNPELMISCHTLSRFEIFCFNVSRLIFSPFKRSISEKVFE